MKQVIQLAAIMLLAVVALTFSPSVKIGQRNDLSRIEIPPRAEAAILSSEEKKPVTRAPEQPKVVAVSPPVKPIEPPTPVVAPSPATCQSETVKYDWVDSVALAVAEAESGFDPANLNDNPSTGDYSIGCFQINIYGANARNRPSEAELKDPVVNVA